MDRAIRDRVALAWKTKNIEGMRALAGEFALAGRPVESQALEAFALSLAGDIAGAYQAYSRIDLPCSDGLIRNLFKIDFQYCTTKLRRKSEKISLTERLRVFFRLLPHAGESLGKQTVHHLFYTWYITAFWYNHFESLLAGLGLLAWGLVTFDAEALTHGQYLVGHLANVKGYGKIGVALVRSAFARKSRIGPWLEAPFLSYMAYGLYMVGQGDDIIAQVLKEAQISLSRYPDPFYEILLDVSILRFSSQIGDIETAEAVAAKLIAFGEKTNTHRFYFSSKADLALCYGIRGLYWRCDEILRDLELYSDAEADPVEAGSFYRLRGWSYFFVGKYPEALADAERALARFAQSKSFFMAVSMSEILKENSLFRIELDGCGSVESSLEKTERHLERLKKMKRKFRANQVLIKMIAEEEQSLLSSFGRFWEPGYSRDVNVVSCQQRLYSAINDVASAASDQEAWSIMMAQVTSSLPLQLISIEAVNRNPGFEIRSTHGDLPGIEMVIDRSGSGVRKYEIVKLSLVSGNNLLSVLDALFTLLPTVDCLLKIRDQQALLLSAERDKTFHLVASQVSHDIRSPLSALNMVLGTLQDLPEEKRLIVRNATQRINDIANSLLKQGKKVQATTPAQTGSAPRAVGEPVMLVALLDAIVSEKRMQFRERMEIDIQGDLDRGYGLFARVTPTDFARAISNLINNSVEAFAAGGRVTVGISGSRSEITLTVTDNGKGIPAAVLAKLGERGVTHGKEHTQSGSGLGVYHARDTFEKAGGKFRIESQVGVGTRVTITLPRAETPAWFVDRIQLEPDARIVSVDDDQTIHQVWRERITPTGLSAERHSAFSSVDCFRDWMQAADLAKVVILVDYEFLGQTQNGLDLIEKTGIAPKAILVTSRFEEPAVRLRAERMGVRIIPKPLAPFVPIGIENRSTGAC